MCTFQGFDMDPQQAPVFHQSIESSGRSGKADAIEALEPDTNIQPGLGTRLYKFGAYLWNRSQYLLIRFHIARS